MKSVKVSAKGLIKKGNKFLLIKEKIKDHYIWDLPGGKIEFGETPKEACAREVQEELGVKVDVKELIGTFQFVTEITGDQIVCLVYKCTLSDFKKIDLTKNPAKNEEIVKYRLFKISQLKIKNFSIAPNCQKFLRNL